MKDTTKSAIFSIFGRPNFNGYRGTIYESEYQKFFMYHGGEKHFNEYKDNKLILNMETKKLYINGNEIADGTFGDYEADKPIQYGLVSWLDGFDSSTDNIWKSRTGKFNGAITIGDTDSTAGFKDNGVFRTGPESFVRIADTTFNNKESYTISMYIDTYTSKGFAQNKIMGFGDVELKAIHKYFCLFLDNCLPTDVHLDMCAEDGVIVTLACNNGKLDVYCNGFKLYTEIDLTPMTRVWNFINLSNNGAHGIMADYKSVLIYDRWLNEKEVKHNYLYHRYYRDSDRALDLKVVPIIQELNGLEGFTKPNGYDKNTFTMNSDGTFGIYAGAGQLSGQIYEFHDRRVVSHGSLAYSSVNKLFEDRYQCTAQRLGCSSFHIKFLERDGAATPNLYCRHFTRLYNNDVSRKKMCITFNVLYMNGGTWSYGYVGRETLLHNGFNCIIVDIRAEHQLCGIYCDNSDSRTELIIDNYKCEVITDLNSFEKIYTTGNNPNEFNSYSDDVIPGVYKGNSITNTANNPIDVHDMGRGVRLKNITTDEDGWHTGEIELYNVSDTTPNFSQIFINCNSTSLKAGTSISASIELKFTKGLDSSIITPRLTGAGTISNLIKASGHTYKAVGIAPVDGYYNIYISVDRTNPVINGARIKWKNPCFCISPFQEEYCKTNRLPPAMVYDIKKCDSTFMPRDYSFYMEFYLPQKKIDYDSGIKLICVNGNTTSDGVNENITNHTAYYNRSTDYIPMMYSNKINTILVHRDIMYINGNKIGNMYPLNIFNLKKLTFVIPNMDNADSYLRCIATRCELYDASKLALTEQQCIDISKYGLKINNREGVLPKIRQVEEVM